MPLFTILTLFPEALQAYLDQGILGSALRRGLAEVRLVDFRDFARDRHRTVDDRPFGGGPGMVLKAEPIAEAIEWIEEHWGEHRKWSLCPAGTPFAQQHAARAAEDAQSGTPHLLLCGRYEGFDERIYELFDIRPFSIGDFVLAGGELPALALVESIVRLLPGALGDDRSALEDSFGAGDTGELDHPHYTRPRVFRGHSVPDVLTSGDHEAIDAWRQSSAQRRTREMRPDLADQ